MKQAARSIRGLAQASAGISLRRLGSLLLSSGLCVVLADGRTTASGLSLAGGPPLCALGWKTLALLLERVRLTLGPLAGSEREVAGLDEPNTLEQTTATVSIFITICQKTKDAKNVAIVFHVLGRAPSVVPGTRLEPESSRVAGASATRRIAALSLVPLVKGLSMVQRCLGERIDVSDSVGSERCKHDIRGCRSVGVLRCGGVRWQW